MGLIMCELRFTRANPQNPEFSLLEPNFYVWIPAEKKTESDNHRLSIRKNMETGKFEVCRSFRDGSEHVIYQGSFENALKRGSKEFKKFHGRDLDDEPCRHKQPKVDPLCPSFNVRNGQRRYQT
jgi:hypothetical protein